MRTATFPMLLAVACLLCAPCVAPAQTGSAVPMHGAPAVSSANAAAPKSPLAWSSLTTSQQRMLAPVRGQWNQLRPSRQHRLATHATHWASLPPKHQHRIRQRLSRWAAMTPAQRRRLRENARAFHNLTPAEREKVSEAFHKFQSMPPARRRALRERWREMTPAQRRHWATEHPDKPISMHPPAHDGH